MGVLTRLDISENGLRVAGTKALTEGLKGNQIMTELNINISSNGMGRSGAIALANAMPDMGALTSLNLSSNLLKAKGAKIVAGAIKVTKCTTAVVLVPSSCPSI
jgi:Ran GTPase-activating protein (RanGAP) involved in mRNA processing and transport